MASITREQYAATVVARSSFPKTEGGRYGYVYILAQHIRGGASGWRDSKRELRRGLAPDRRANARYERGYARDRSARLSAGSLRVRRVAHRRQRILAAVATRSVTVILARNAKDPGIRWE